MLPEPVCVELDALFEIFGQRIIHLPCVRVYICIHQMYIILGRGARCDGAVPRARALFATNVSPRYDALLNSQSINNITSWSSSAKSSFRCKMSLYSASISPTCRRSMSFCSRTYFVCGTLIVILRACVAFQGLLCGYTVSAERMATTVVSLNLFVFLRPSTEDRATREAGARGARRLQRLTSFTPRPSLPSFSSMSCLIFWEA